VALTFRPVGAQIEDTLEKHFIAAQQAMEARLAKVTFNKGMGQHKFHFERSECPILMTFKLKLRKPK
jgi:hypothetical protein